MILGWLGVLLSTFILSVASDVIVARTWIGINLVIQAFLMLADVPADGYSVEIGQLERPEERGQVLATGQRIRFFSSILGGLIQALLVNGPTTNAPGCPIEASSCWAWGLTPNQYYGLNLCILIVLVFPVFFLVFGVVLLVVPIVVRAGIVIVVAARTGIVAFVSILAGAVIVILRIRAAVVVVVVTPIALVSLVVLVIAPALAVAIAVIVTVISDHHHQRRQGDRAGRQGAGAGRIEDAGRGRHQKAGDGQKSATRGQRLVFLIWRPLQTTAEATEYSFSSIGSLS
jgi:MFS family permease